jgi:hypothetical protein
MALLLLSACASPGNKAEDTPAAAGTSSATASAPHSATARKPAANRPAASTPRGAAAAPVPLAPPAAGLNDKGEVVDSARLAAGSGQKVRGRAGWEGEISGRPAPGSKLAKVEIGMSLREVTDLLGPPSDQGVYSTKKAWLPFYFGADRHRYELVYRGQGRLVFAGGSITDTQGGNLIWIIHNMNEASTRS